MQGGIAGVIREVEAWHFDGEKVKDFCFCFESASLDAYVRAALTRQDLGLKWVFERLAMSS